MHVAGLAQAGMLYLADDIVTFAGGMSLASTSLIMFLGKFCVFPFTSFVIRAVCCGVVG